MNVVVYYACYCIVRIYLLDRGSHIEEIETSWRTARNLVQIMTACILSHFLRFQVTTAQHSVGSKGSELSRKPRGCGRGLCHKASMQIKTTHVIWEQG